MAVLSSVPGQQNDNLVPEPKQSSGKQHHVRVVVLIVFIFIELVGLGSVLFYKHIHKTTKPPTTVKIGILQAFSGGSSDLGYGTLEVAQYAKQQLNANNVQFVTADSQCDPKDGPNAIKSLVAQQVVAIIGDDCSSAVLAELPFANNAQIPMISPSASSNELSIANDYFFRVVPPDSFQGTFLAQTVYNAGIRTVGVFYTNESYGTGISKVFTTKFESLGGKVVATTFSPVDSIDLSTQVATLKAANPQALFFAPNSTITGSAIINQVRAAGMSVPLYGSDVFYDPTILSDAGTAAQGLTFTTFPIGSSSFQQAILNAYGITTPPYAAAQIYDSFHAIDIALQKGATTGVQVKSILQSESFTGESGRITFDKYGEISYPGYQYTLLKIENGNFTPINQQ